MKAGANMPMGPFALLDLVGLDVSVAILDALYAENPDPFLQPAQTLRRMVSAGRLGRKAGQGFYEYGKNSGRRLRRLAMGWRGPLRRENGRVRRGTSPG